MTNFKKRTTAGILILLILLKLTYPVAVLADEVVLDSPTPTPTEQITPTPEQTVTVDATSDANIFNNNNSTADSGNNSISTTCDIPTSELNLSPDAQNAVETNSCPTPTPDPFQNTIDTGSATSITSVENNVDLTSVNSSLTNQNTTVDGVQNLNLNLGNVQNSATSPTPANAEPTGLVFNSVDNSATLNNVVVSVANTGENKATGSADIQTGDSYSIVNVVNNVSLTLINSTLQILSLNIFGTLNGNVTLPDSSGSLCDLCSSNTHQEINSNATVNNNVDSQAISGQNSVSDVASATIASGQSISIVNLLNLVNSLYIGSNVKAIFVNVFGTWNGDFVGWGDISSATGGSNLKVLNSNLSGPGVPCGCLGSSQTYNNTVVSNDVTSIANTGKNTVIGGDSGNVTTGNAFSEISILNLVNNTFINSTGVFAFINIFGALNGDIGGFSKFQTKEDSPQPHPQTEQTNNKDQGGGQLSLIQTNNVGEYVLPGDTVTFNIKVKNPGSGIVRNAKVHLDLVRDGRVVGGADFNIGDISPGRGKTLTTGLVLSKSAHAGHYSADATAEGVSGDNTVTAEALSGFSVFVPNFGFIKGVQDKQEQPKVLSAATSVKSKVNYPTKASFDYKTLLLLALLYLIVRVLRNYKEIGRISQSKSILTFVEFAQRMLM